MVKKKILTKLITGKKKQQITYLPFLYVCMNWLI